MSDKSWNEKAPSNDQAGGQASSGQASQGGFVGSQAEDSSGYVQQESGEQGFAPQGRGAEDEDEETRSQNRNSDIEGSSSQSPEQSGSDSSSQ